MREVTRYICELCGTVYESADECRACEQSHNSPVRITPVFSPSGGAREPDALVAHFADGSSKKYIRQQRMGARYDDGI